MVIIGLGEAGKNICSKMPKNGNIRTVVLDAGKNLPECSTHEEYEERVPKLANKLRLGKEQDVWLIVSGAGRVSGACLAILEQLKDRKVNVIHISADPLLISKTQHKQQKVVFNVLQQYARSGMFDALWLFSNPCMQEFLGEGSIENYYENINNAIVNFLSNYGYFKNTKPFMGSHHEPNKISRIRTVSIGDQENKRENLYFLLDNITESCYYYSVSEEDKKNNKNFLTTVKRHVIIDKEKHIESSFGLWENSSDFSYFYSVKFTHYIQSENT